VSYDLILIFMTAVFVIRKILRRIFGPVRHADPQQGPTAS
jgi:hypothetical protein